MIRRVRLFEVVLVALAVLSFPSCRGDEEEEEEEEESSTTEGWVGTDVAPPSSDMQMGTDTAPMGTDMQMGTDMPMGTDMAPPQGADLAPDGRGAIRWSRGPDENQKSWLAWVSAQVR